MTLYLIVILISDAIIATLNAVFSAPVYGFSPLYAVLATLIGTVAVIAVDGLLAFAIRKLPEKYFSSGKKFFTVSKKERNFYEKIKIRKWKDLLPDLGRIMHFAKSKVEKPQDNEYLTRYMLEACYGEIIHIVSVFLGFAIIFIFPLKYVLLFGAPIGFVNAVLNVMPTMALRYNFYKMKILYASNARRERETS